MKPTKNKDTEDIKKHQTEKGRGKQRSRFRYSLRDENDKAIAELELKRQKIEKDIEHEETELSRLEEQSSSIEKACNDAQQLFQSMLAELKAKLLSA